MCLSYGKNKIADITTIFVVREEEDTDQVIKIVLYVVWNSMKF